MTTTNEQIELEHHKLLTKTRCAIEYYLMNYNQLNTILDTLRELYKEYNKINTNEGEQINRLYYAIQNGYINGNNYRKLNSEERLKSKDRIYDIKNITDICSTNMKYQTLHDIYNCFNIGGETQTQLLEMRQEIEQLQKEVKQLQEK
jgi:hypothetical protein